MPRKKKKMDLQPPPLSELPNAIEILRVWLDLLAAAQLGRGRAEEARASWLEAQWWSELAGEEPVEYCRRWADLARAATPGESAAERAAAYRAAIWGYRSLRFHDDAARLLAEHARLERQRRN